MVVVKLLLGTCDGERCRFGVRMLLALTVRVVVSEVVRVKVEDWGLRVETPGFWACLDEDRWSETGCEVVLALTSFSFVRRIESLLIDSAGFVDSSSSVCFE